MDISSPMRTHNNVQPTGGETSRHPSSSTSSPRSWRSSDETAPHATPPSAASTMSHPPPFDVPPLWRAAISMVSINAGLTPQLLLNRYYDAQPRQAAGRGYAELDIYRSRRARDRGVRLVHVRYRDGDPAAVYALVLFVDPVAEGRRGGAVRLVTGASVRHVLEAPCADCPLWLPVAEGSNGPPYRVVPCCAEWVDSVDFGAPVSDEEMQVPAVVDRMVLEMQRKIGLLAEKEKEMGAKDEEINAKDEKIKAKDEEIAAKGEAIKAMEEAIKAKNEELVRLRERAAASTSHHACQATQLDMGMVAQYWWVGAMIVAFLVVIIFK